MQDEVLDGHVLSILIGAGEDDLTIDGKGTEVLVLSDGGDEEYIFVLQGDIGRGAIEDALDIDGEHFLRAVGLHAAHDGTAAHRLFRQATGHLEQRAHTVDLLTQTIHAGTEDGTLDLDHVLITVDDGIDDDLIAIIDLEVCQLKLLDIIDALQVFALAEHTEELLEGIAREAPTVFQ